MRWVCRLKLVSCGRGQARGSGDNLEVLVADFFDEFGTGMGPRRIATDSLLSSWNIPWYRLPHLRNFLPVLPYAGEINALLPTNSRCCKNNTNLITSTTTYRLLEISLCKAHTWIRCLRRTLIYTSKIKSSDSLKKCLYKQRFFQLMLTSVDIHLKQPQQSI